MSSVLPAIFIIFATFFANMIKSEHITAYPKVFARSYKFVESFNIYIVDTAANRAGNMFVRDYVPVITASLARDFDFYYFAACAQQSQIAINRAERDFGHHLFRPFVNLFGGKVRMRIAKHLLDQSSLPSHTPAPFITDITESSLAMISSLPAFVSEDIP